MRCAWDRPATHIDADLGHEFERPIRSQAWDRGQVDACAQRIQRDPDLEAGFVGTPPPRGSGRVRRLIGGLAGRLEGADLALDLVVAAADLRLVEVVALERLAKHEQMFGAVVLRRAVGLGRRRGLMMGAGTLGGLSFGVLAAYPISDWLKTDVSVISACLGTQLGWAVSWVVARRVRPIPS